MAISIGPKIGIEGEKEFRNALQNIIQQCKTLASESDRVSTAFKKNTDAISAFKNQSDALQQQLAKQSQRVEQLYQMYEQCSDIYGELDTRTLKWKQALNQAETEADGIRSKISDLNVELEKDAVTTATKNVESLQAEYDRITNSVGEYTSELDKTKDQYDALNKVCKAQADKVEALCDLYKTSEKQLGRNSDELIDYQTAISKAKTELSKFQKELADLPKKLAISDLQKVSNVVDALKAKYTAISESVGVFASEEEKAAAKAENLQNQIYAQNEKINKLNQVYKICVNQQGRASEETLKYRNALDQANNELLQMADSLSRVTLELKKTQIETETKKIGLLSAEYDKASTSLEKHKNALQQNKTQREILSREIEEQKTKIKLLNEAYNEANNALDKNENELLEWKTDIVQATTELDNLQWQLKEMPTQLQVIGDKCAQMGSKLTGIGTTLSASVTTPLIALATSAVNNYGNVDKTFRQVKATIGDTSSEEEFEHLWDTMMDEATKSVYDVQDAADALLNYAQAGYSATDCANMLHGAFALAAGTGTDMSTVTSGLSVALKAFSADTKEADHYADVFAKGQAQARITTTGLVDSLSYAAPVFAALGYSIEDLTAAVGMMGDAGNEGAEAGGALRTGLMRLAAPTENASVLMQQLGLEASDVSEMFSEEEGSLEDCAAAMEQYGLSSQTIFDAQGNIRPMVEIIENLNSAFSDLTQKEKMDAIDTIFGKNRGSAWLSLIDQGSEKFQKLKTDLEDCDGAADAMADALMDGTGGAIEKLKSDFDVFQQYIAESLAPTVEDFTGKLSAMMDWYMQLDPETQNQIATFGLYAAALGPVLIVLGQVLGAVSAIAGFAKGIGEVWAGLTGVIDAGGVIAGGAGGIAGIIGGFAGVIGGAALAVFSFADACVNGLTWVKELGIIVGSVIGGIALAVLGVPGIIAAAIAVAVGGILTAIAMVVSNWDNLVGYFKGKWMILKMHFSEGIDTIKQRLGSFISWVKAQPQIIWLKISSFIDKIADGFNKLGGDLADWASGLVEDFIGWGKDFIDGLAEGIRKGIDYVKKAGGEVASAIAKFLHFSEPDVGPLSKFHTWMPDMMNQLAEGMLDNRLVVSNAALTVAGDMAGAMAPTGTTNNTNVGGITIVVNGAAGQDVNELADVVMHKINNQFTRNRVAFG